MKDRASDQHNRQSGDREKSNGAPDIPGGKATRVVVARQATFAGGELVLENIAHHFGGSVVSASPEVGIGGLHVRLIVESFEAMDGLVLFRFLVSEEQVQQLDESLFAASEIDSPHHVVDEAEGVIPVFAFVVVGILTKQACLFIKGVRPVVGQGNTTVVDDLIAQSLGHLGNTPIGEGEIESVRKWLNDMVSGEFRKFTTSSKTTEAGPPKLL